MSFTEQPGVKFTRRDDNDRPAIEYFTTVSSDVPWPITGVPHSKQKTYQLRQHNDSDDFDFVAITFWGQDKHMRLATQVSRSFEKSKNGRTVAREGVTVDSIDTQKKDHISFRITNQTTVSGFVALQVTILDKQGSAGQALFTSVDPPIPTPLN